MYCRCVNLFLSSVRELWGWDEWSIENIVFGCKIRFELLVGWFRGSIEWGKLSIVFGWNIWI